MPLGDLFTWKRGQASFRVAVLSGEQFIPIGGGESIEHLLLAAHEVGNTHPMTSCLSNERVVASMDLLTDADLLTFGYPNEAYLRLRYDQKMPHQCLLWTQFHFNQAVLFIDIISSNSRAKSVFRPADDPENGIDYDCEDVNIEQECPDIYSDCNDDDSNIDEDDPDNDSNNGA